MEPRDVSNTDRWVEGRLATLTPSEEWQPDVTQGLELLHRGRLRADVWRRRSVYAIAGAVTLAGVLTFPATRVFARRCAEACVAQTETVRDLLWTRQRPTVLTEGLIGISQRTMAGDFQLEDSAGRLVRLADLRGQVVLLNFWATWCAPCKVEIPWFDEFSRKYRKSGLVVLGVAMDEGGWKTVKPYIGEHRISYQVILGDDQVARNFGGVQSLPTTVLIDRAGRIALIHEGLVDAKTYEENLQSLLAER